MEESLAAYAAGRSDALDGRRDPVRAAHEATGADYRMGFLDARIDVFRMLAGVRRLLTDNG